MTLTRFKFNWRWAVTGVIVVSIMISVGFNVLSFWEKKRTELINLGVQQVLLLIAQQAATGEVRITYDNGVLVLIPKLEVESIE